MAFDIEFLEKIILIAIPLIIAIIGSKLVINSWQIKKEKFNLRLEILKDFSKTYPYGLSISSRFYQKLTSNYVIFPKNTKAKGEIIQGVLDFPINNENLPKEKFSEEHKQMIDEITEINFNSTLFVSSIELYFEESNNIIKQFDKIAKCMNGVDQSLYDMVNSSQKEEFEKANLNYHMHNKALRKEIFEGQKLLINSKMKNPS